MGTEPLEFHPLANLFPLMRDEELASLATDIREHGLREPIIMYQGKILDGRNRYRACEIAGVALGPEAFEEFNGTDAEALALVISYNVHRRHLSTSRRALVAGRVESRPLGWNKYANDDDKNLAPSLAALSRVFAVSDETIRQARLVLKHCPKPVIAAIDKDYLAVSAAHEWLAVHKDEEGEFAFDDEHELVVIESEDQSVEDVATIIMDNIAELRAKGAAEPESESTPKKTRKALPPAYRNAPLLKMLDKWHALGAAIRATIDGMTDESRAQFMKDKGDRELPMPPKGEAKAIAA